MAWLMAAIGLLAGCRLYEPPRYTRTTRAAEPGTIRVLMIGDSLTYYNDLPGLLQQFSARETHPIYIEQSTFPAWSLRLQWEFSDARQRIDEGHWNYVVLQDYSRKPVTDPGDCLRFYERFGRRAKRAGAKIIIFENWTRRGRSNEFQALETTYRRIVERTGGIAAPIGEAFRIAKRLRPDIHLLVDDRHPSDAGTYLAGCVLYDVIYNKRSAGLPWDLPGPKLSREVMESLRAFADRAVWEGSGEASPRRGGEKSAR